MTIADLLNRMMVFDSELKTGAGLKDESRSITALNMAQDLMEGAIAKYPRVCGSAGSMATVANAETTTRPAALLRVDGNLWTLNASSLPENEIELFDTVGGHRPTFPYPFNLISPTSTGKPRATWADEDLFYWLPIPDAVYTIRVYGFYRADDFAVRNDPFAYDDLFANPMAAFAVKLLRIGRDDPIDALSLEADKVFADAIAAKKRFTRASPKGRTYTQLHRT